MRVLLVEDEPTAAQVLAKGLREQSHAVDLAADGRSALFQVGTTDYDAVILDVMLPFKDGFTVCRKIKEDPRLKDIPVIFLTAKGGGEALAEGFESGAVMYINKPFTANKLLTIVKTMLEAGTNLT